jgi:ABC-type Fe3+ transport system substrate-binding protein
MTLAVLLVLACSPAAPAPSAKGPAAPATGVPSGPAAAAAATAPASAAPAAAAGPASAPAASDWDRLNETAKREGRVVVTGPGFPGLRNGLVEGFERAYGIGVEYVGLGGAEAITRVDREARAGRPTIDVTLGGFTGCWTMAERDQIQDVTTALVDPSVLNPSVWRDGKVKYILPSPNMPQDFTCGLQTAEWVMTDLFVNPQLVPPDSIKSWKDLLKPEYKGKIASFDPRGAGPAQTTVPYLNRLFGVDYLRDLYVGQEVALTTDNRQLAEWVARGTHPIGIALVQAAVEPMRAEGLPLERAYPADGPGVLTSGFGSAMKIKGGPNPNAGALFINWIASKEAQEIWEREMLETSRRTDVAHNVPEYVIPRPGVEYTVDATEPEQFFGYGAQAREALQQMLGR